MKDGMKFAFITDGIVRELVEQYYSEACMAVDHGVYMGALACAGGVLEGVLAWALSEYSAESQPERFARRERGVLIFSQYYDSAYALGRYLVERLDEPIGLYANSSASKLFEDGKVLSIERELLKEKVTRGRLKLLIGTDACKHWPKSAAPRLSDKS